MWGRGCDVTVTTLLWVLAVQPDLLDWLRQQQGGGNGAGQRLLAARLERAAHIRVQMSRRVLLSSIRLGSSSPEGCQGRARTQMSRLRRSAVTIKLTCTIHKVMLSGAGLAAAF